MERAVIQIQQSLQKLIGLHRQLLDTVRLEHEALANADLKSVQESTFAKQGLIENIKAAESERMKAVAELSTVWKKNPAELTLSAVIIEVQGRDQKMAEQLRSSLNALTILVKRVTDQNEYNRLLVDRSLENIHQMKKNVLGEAVPRNDVYTSQGRKATGAGGSRLLSTEV